LSSVIGSLEPGKAADMICIDLGSLADRPAATVSDAVLFSSTRRDVSDVWVGGRAAVSSGHLLAFDEQDLARLARDWAQRIESGGTA